MTRNFDPFTVGFDRIFDEFENIASRTHKVKYPPYNIIRTGNQYMIDMAVAGFKKNDIEIEFKKDTLTVVGRAGNPLEAEAKSNSQYIYKGLANRDFTHKFKVASNVEVKSATMEDGMLHITLEEYTPEEDKPLKIELS
jgi:molecular chaperone IbpA